MPKYYAKVLEKIDNGKGYWNYERIGIFDDETEIGSYVRNYSSYGERTFFPFMQDGEWFALYSKDYTATRVMRLPSCEDICGEESHGFGFCPVDYYVPFGVDYNDSDCGPWTDKDGVEHQCWTHRSDINGKIGFVAGCIWGDDCSWKIEFLDLSKIKEGVFVRDARFGYIELLSNQKLKDAICLDNYDSYEDEYPYVSIACMKSFPVWTKEQKNEA